MSKDCYIKDMHYGESSVMKDGFTVTRGEAGALEIVVSSRGARVQGTVMDSDGLPLAGVSIVLVPDLSQRENYQKYKTESTDQYGHFDLRGLRLAITNYSVGWKWKRMRGRIRNF